MLPSSKMPKKRVISDDLAAYANKAQKLSISPPQKGHRKVSASLLSSPDSGYGSSPTSAQASKSQTEGPYCEIPVELYSVEALEFIGYTREKAERFFKNYANEPEKEGRWSSWDDLLCGEIRNSSFHELNDPDTEERDCFRVMEKLGIKESLQKGIIAPDMSDIRRTHDLKYWLLFFIEQNWLSLQTLEGTIGRNVQELKEGAPSLRGGYGSEADATTAYDWRLPGHITLYRSTSIQRLADVFQNDRAHLEDMEQSWSKNDFAAENADVFYWSKDLEVADKYVDYLRENSVVPGDIVTIRMVFPLHSVTGLSRLDLEFGDTWKKMIWYFRSSRHRKGKGIPEDLAALLKDKEVVVGPLSNVSDGYIRNLSSWKRLSERHVASCRGKALTQFVFVGKAAMARASQHGDGKIHLFKIGQKLLPNPKAHIERRLEVANARENN